MPEDHCGVQRRPAFAVGNAGICPDGEQPLDFFDIAADHGAMQQRVAERVLIVGISYSVVHECLLCKRSP